MLLDLSERQPRNRVPGVAGRARGARRGQGVARLNSVAQALLERDDIAQGFKLVDGNVGRDDKKVTLPHYLVPYLY